ncbi:YjgN family protein [Rheinheimera sp.]|uniref:YjgN family protein n=1 Tax=Rheinheimera sp. TaxID=1869214 RepID=UPI002735EDEE|nr:YjgN family protein [Rheinheimera sp.]MDP2714445.1 YjgN family protein [Rheinheimera sp.]
MENTFGTTTPQPNQARISNVAFSGQAGEFFGIWIVNLLLSIVTLGIYSAWAKVRTNQYFYGHTSIENQSFRYLASPIQILKGRIIAVIIFALFFVLSAVSPIFAVVLALAFLIASPWLIVQSLKFNMRMTSYRNVRFAFNGDYAGAFKHFVLLPVLAVFTLYLAMPWVLKRIDQFVYGNISYGGKQFQANTETGNYYIAALVAIAAVICVGIAFSIISALVIGATAFGTQSSLDGVLGVTGFLIFVMYFLMLTLSGAIYQTMIRNHLFERTELPQIVQFKSEARVMPFLWLTITNLLAIICTLGLAYPWARIRKASYFAGVTTVAVYPQADSLVDQAQQSSSAFGEEAAGLFDIDVSLA